MVVKGLMGITLKTRIVAMKCVLILLAERLATFLWFLDLVRVTIQDMVMILILKSANRYALFLCCSYELAQ